jgi:hypothetical protein
VKVLSNNIQTRLNAALNNRNSPVPLVQLPLPLLVLLEAEQQTGGKSLGTVGSVLVGEVIFRRLLEGEFIIGPFAAKASNAFDGEIWKKITAVCSMPALIKLAEEWHNADASRGMPSE